MDNRHWIGKQSIYDFLCHLNEKDIYKCVVTLCSKKIDADRCMKYNRCSYYFKGECKRNERGLKCDIVCIAFSPKCEKCIADYLNEERR